MTSERDRSLLARAVALSEQGMRANAGGPFGAVVARGDEIAGEGWNRVTSTHDPTAHAEVEAIRSAGRALGTHDLTGCVLYSSCEPCPMCLAAAHWARIEQIVYANTRDDAARIGFDDALLYRELALDPDARRLPLERLDLAEAAEVFRAWEAKPDKIPY